MKSLINKTIFAIIVVATCISCAKENDVLLNNTSHNFTRPAIDKIPYATSSNAKDTPYVTNTMYKGLDTPYVTGKSLDTPYVVGNAHKGGDTPYVTHKLLDTPYVSNIIADTPYVKK
jgi:hypothetical protein